MVSNFEESDAAPSPDGTWLAYTSEESGQAEAYITPFPGPGGKWQISRSGGEGVQWTKEGTEIQYASADGKLMVVKVKSEGTAFEAGTPVELFGLEHFGPGMITKNGERVLVAVRSEEIRHHSLTLVVNWTELLK